MKEQDIGENNNSKKDTIEIPVGKYIGNMRKNPWMVSTLFLIIILMVVIIFRASGTGGAITGNVVKDTDAGNSVISFINSQGKGNAALVSSEREGALYKVIVKYNEQDIPVYVTLDGKYLISQPIPLTADAELANSGNNNAPSSNVKVNLDIGNSPVTGNKDALVTIVEFSDFSCPYCAAASGDNEKLLTFMKQNNPNWEPIVTNLLKEYVDTGKVKFAVKYSFGHGGGHPAQLVAWCLNEQNLYWKFYPQAFAHQDDAENLDKMKELANGLNADMTKLQSCLDSKKYDSQFDKDQNEGTKAGVSGTPAFFVNGRIVEGAVPYSQIKQIIDEELNK